MPGVLLSSAAPTPPKFAQCARQALTSHSHTTFTAPKQPTACLQGVRATVRLAGGPR